MLSKLHLAARTIAAKGMAVMPCQAREKLPATSHGVIDATTDPSTIEKWWALNPDLNVGIACGDISGIFVLDIDGEDGERSLNLLEREHGEPIPPSVEAITGKGRHVYFRLDDNGPIGNSVGLIGAGLDIRGDGGYVLAPPSWHPSGRQYHWSVDSTSEFASAPPWLYAALATEAKATPVEEWRGIVGNTIGEGARNESLTRLTGHLLRHFVDPYVALDLIRCVNMARCTPPLPDGEVVATVNSIAKKEAQRRASYGR